jgi:hypothetical protein
MSKNEIFGNEQLGVDADGALSALSAAGDKAEALVQAWIATGNAGAVAEAAERAAGAAKKAARRGLNVLKSRGVKIPERGRVAKLVQKVEETLEAWMLPPDAAGTVLLVVAARTPSSRYRSAFVVLHDEVGVHRIEVGEMSQSQLKEAMQKAFPAAQYKPVSVPIEWARARIAAARKKHAERKVPEPLGFSSAKALLEPVPATPPGHPFDDEGLELSDEDAADLTAKSAELHALPEFRTWFPTRQAMDEMLVKLGEAIGPGNKPGPDEVGEKLQAEIKAATDRYFTPERREALARAMKDSALGVLSREGEQRALEVAAAIVCVRNRGLITDAPHELPFLRGFFEKAVSLMLAQNAGSLRIPVPPGPPGADTAPAPEAAPTADAAPDASAEPAAPGPTD